MQQGRACAHGFQPLQGVVVSVDLVGHSHEIRPEFGHCPDDSEAFEFGSGVGLFSLIKGMGSAADDPFLALLNLSQDGP